MNVAFDPWIPIVSMEGERMLVSLHEVLTKGNRFADLAVRPHERVSLMRLFICVAHASVGGPKNYPEWCTVSERLPETADRYLKEWKDSFELFHKEKPWLQVAGLNVIPNEKSSKEDDEKGWSTLNKICFTCASGNNTTLFDHEASGNEMTLYHDEEICLNLLAFQNFFVAGGKASSRLWGTNEMKNPPNPKGGPCSGKSILFTFLRGTNLLESVWLNLNTFEDLHMIYGDMNNWLGKPIWEMPITNPYDQSSIENATLTHLGRLVPQTRLLRINEDRRKVLLGAGFLYPKYQDENNKFHPDPFATLVIKDQNKVELLSAKPDKSIWRELHAILVKEKSSTTKNRGPLCMLNISDEESCDILVNAMITNPKQAAEIVSFVDSVYHIPSRLRMPEGMAIYEEEVKVAEIVANRLGWAVEGYRNEIDSGWEGRLKAAGASKGEIKIKLRAKSNLHFWTTVEKTLHLLMAHIDAIGTEKALPTREKWRKMLFATACESYRVTCGQETPRQIRAFAKGWMRLMNKEEKVTAIPAIKEEGV